MMPRLLILLTLWAAIPVGAQELEPESWIDSPEAYFATMKEREEWIALSSRAEKDAFKERYWLKRDPTPGTLRNEFREMVLARIGTADARFPIGGRVGSRSARGMVFIVFGTPAAVRDQRHQPPPAPPPPGAPPLRVPIGFVEGTETTSMWFWDRQRTPKILEAVGLPSLSMTMVIEPNRKSDRLQNPGLFNELREKLAERSVTNPQLIAAPAEAAPHRAVAPFDSLLVTELPARIGSALATAPAVTRSAGNHVFGHAIVWREQKPVATAWFFLPDLTPHEASTLMLYGRVENASGNEVARIGKRVTPEPAFLTSTPGLVTAVRIPLLPGNFTGYFGVFDSSGRAVTTARAPWKVPDLSEKFGVPNLLLAGGANLAAADASGDFLLGRVEVLPRADATFLQSESLWYFFEVINPSAAAEVKAQIRLRHGGTWIGATRVVDAALEEIETGRYVSGFEMTLATLDPGDYSLYVTIGDGTTEVVRRADFRVLAR